MKMKQLIFVLGIVGFMYSCSDENSADLEPLFFSCSDGEEQHRYEEYNGMIEGCTFEVTSEDFRASKNENWEQSKSGKYKRSVVDGRLVQESLNNTNWYFFNDVVIDDTWDSYQIEAEIHILSGEKNDYHVVSWLGGGGLDNFYSFGISRQKEVRVGHYIKKQDFRTLQYTQAESAITDGTNLMTIRVNKNMSYLFINKKLVFSSSIDGVGREVGFNVPAQSTNALDNIRIHRYISE